MSEQENGTRISMDFTLPLWGVLTCVGGGFVLMVGLFFNVQQLTKSVQDLQITVQAGNTAYSSLASRTTLIEFRTQMIEDGVKLLDSQINPRGMK